MAAKGFIELLRLADLAEARASGRHNIQKSHWTGIVFELAGERFVAPMGEISEVLSLPEYTNVPLVKHWLLGVANVRGRLLPLTDMAAFLGQDNHKVRLTQKKVLVVDQDPYYLGLVVDQVMGIQAFTENQYRAEALPIDSPFAKFNHGKFYKDEQDWLIFMPSLLVQDNQFMDAVAVN